MVNLTTRNIVYFVIIVLFVVITVWYLSTTYEGYDNLDDVLNAASSCGDPNGCKTTEEIKSEGEATLLAKQAELEKSLLVPSKIIISPVLITLYNNDEPLPIEIAPPQSSLYLPPDPLLLDTTESEDTTKSEDTTESEDTTKSKDTSKPILGSMSSPAPFRLNEDKTDVYMLDVDPDEEGIKPEIYNISTLSVKYPDTDLTISTFGDYKTHSQLRDIYMNRREKYNNIRLKSSLLPGKSSLLPELIINEKYIGIKDQSIPIQLDAGRSNDNFIIITPKTNEVFPTKFELIITNNMEVTNVMMDLWNDVTLNQSLAQPVGNANRILDNNTLNEYLNSKKDTFGYSKNSFGDSCLVIEEKACMVGKLDIGKRAINIIQSGSIYDDKNNLIGSVKKNKYHYDEYE